MTDAKKSNPITKLFRIFPALVDRFFAWYGGYLADHAIWFLVIPILVSFTLAPGMVQLNRETDDSKIWPMRDGSTINSPAANDHFNSLPTICSCYDCDENGENCFLSSNCEHRVPKLCKGAEEGLGGACPNIMLMFTSKNNLSLTDPRVVAELFDIDMKVTYKTFINNMFKPRYFASDNPDLELCKRSADGGCIQFSILTAVRRVFGKLYGKKTEQEYLGELTQSDKELMFGMMSDFNYPFESDEPNAAFTGPIFGAVELQNSSETWRLGHKASKMKHVGAFRMYYCLNSSEDMFETNGDWAEDLRLSLEDRYVNNNSFTLFNLEVASSWSPGVRTMEEITRLFPALTICLLSLMAFSGLTTLRGHPAHRILPWIGPIGVGCSVLACVAGFGLVGWMGIEIVDLCFVTPLLILAVGIDDVFVYTENWRFTKPEWTLRKRTVVTMRRAAPGIMVTSFMNSLAFIIDTQSPFYVLQVFSNVSVIVAAFDLTFQMTVFPAALTLLGEADVRTRHGCLCCVNIKPRTFSDYRKHEFCYLMCCTAPESLIVDVDKKSRKSPSRSKEKKKEKSEKSKKPKHFFMDVYAPFLLQPKVTVIAILIYAGYLVTCAILATQIHVGLRFENMVPKRRAGGLNEFEVIFKYFREFSYPVDILFNGEIEYWNETVQNTVNELYEDLLIQPHIGPDILGRNWLRDFVNYTKENNLNISTEQQFVYNLRFRFLNERKLLQDLLNDIRFADQTTQEYEDNKLYFNGEYFSKILASRLVIYSIDVKSMSESGEVVTALKNVKQKYENKLEYNIYNFEFITVEPMLATAFIVVTNTLVQLTAIMVVTTLMMPHPVALFWIAIILSSITIGVISITCTWGVDFDQVAMINIMLTMGYCVDFSAHMTRTYVHSKGKTRYDKTREALGVFGFPVIQSSIAALMAVLGLGGSYAYILSTGFKFFVVGISLSVFHTMVVFPVLLVYLGPQPLKQVKKIRKSRSHHRQEGGDAVEENPRRRHPRRTVEEVEPHRETRMLKSKLDNIEFFLDQEAHSIEKALERVATIPMKRTEPTQVEDVPSVSNFVVSKENTSMKHSFPNFTLKSRFDLGNTL